MADIQIQDLTVMIIIAMLFNYFILYKKNRFIGNVVFAGIGIAILSLGTGTIYSVVGFIILIGSIISFTYDFFGIIKGKTK